MNKIYLRILLLTISLLGTTNVRAQTVIDSLPYTIITSGTYVLTKNLSYNTSSGSLITVNSSNVTIDFQDHYIAATPNNSGLASGIYAIERSNITIKNGTIAYCYKGIDMRGNGQANTNSVDHQIDNMRATYCTGYGIYLSNSLASRVTNCQVSHIGFNGTNTATGIATYGAGITVQGNVVSTITATYSYGITAETGSFVRQNTISNAGYCSIYGGKYQDNLTANSTFGVTNGIDAGGNN